MTTIAFMGGALLGFALGLLVSLAENQWYWRGVRRDGSAADRRLPDDGTADRSS